MTQDIDNQVDSTLSDGLEEPKKSETIQSDIVCSNCAAKLVFQPGTTSLKCPYCGTLNAIEAEQVSIDELDFEEYLQKAEAGDDIEETATIACEACGAVTTLAPNVVSGECPFCGNKLVVKNETTSRQLKPKSILPFKITDKEALTAYRKWLKGLWFAPPKLKTYARQSEKLTGLYLPYWTYDSDTTTTYTGARGDNYTVTVDDGDGKSHSETHTRWTNAAGCVTHFFDDVIVTASKSLPNNTLTHLQPWDLENLMPYNDKYLSGFRTEAYSIGLKDGFDNAKVIMNPTIDSLIRSDIGGDCQRVHTKNTTFTNVTFKHTLLPIWISAYKYNGKVYRFIINARTAKVFGERPWCWWKILITVILVIAAVVGLYYLISNF